jgi:hypothetical protein
VDDLVMDPVFEADDLEVAGVHGRLDRAVDLGDVRGVDAAGLGVCVCTQPPPPSRCPLPEPPAQARADGAGPQ